MHKSTQTNVCIKIPHVNHLHMLMCIEKQTLGLFKSGGRIKIKIKKKNTSSKFQLTLKFHKQVELRR